MSNEREFSRHSQGDSLSAQARDELRPPPLILGVDTASEQRSLVVMRGAETLAAHDGDKLASNSSAVLGDIDRVLQAASVSVKQIDLYAVAVGPGSFTGLRAGLATVKALALTLGKQAVGIQTLEAVAHGAMASESVLTLMPAGRGEVFWQLFKAVENGTNVEQTPPGHLAPGELIEYACGLRGSLTWAGSGVEKHRALIESAARDAGIELGEALSENTTVEASRGAARVWNLSAPTDGLARQIATLALEKIGAGLCFSAESLRAVYVRGADARINCA